jgi:hypothetical protein
MSTNVVAENSMVRIGRVLTVWLVALKVAWVATAMGGPAADLISAAERGDATAVKALLAKRADVNAKRSDGATALIPASENGHLDVVQALLARGAEVNFLALSDCISRAEYLIANQEIRVRFPAVANMSRAS